MKLNKVQLSAETILELDKLVRLRLENFANELKQTGQSPISVLISEMVMMEVKHDALMHILDDCVDIDFTMFDSYMLKCAQGGLVKEGHVRDAMNKPAGPTLVKP